MVAAPGLVNSPRLSDAPEAIAPEITAVSDFQLALEQSRRVMPVLFEREQIGSSTRYSTWQTLPMFMLLAIRDSGHRVEFITYSVSMEQENGDVVEELVTETRISGGGPIEL